MCECGTGDLCGHGLNECVCGRCMLGDMCGWGVSRAMWG